MNQSTWLSQETRVLQDESIRVAAESSRERGESAIGAIFKPALGLQSWPSWEALPAQRGTRWLCHCQKVILRVCPEDKSSGVATGMMEEGRVHRSQSWENRSIIERGSLLDFLFRYFYYLEFVSRRMVFETAEGQKDYSSYAIQCDFVHTCR